jgi:hypothetical protein
MTKSIDKTVTTPYTIHSAVEYTKVISQVAIPAARRDPRLKTTSSLNLAKCRNSKDKAERLIIETEMIIGVSNFSSVTP